MISCQRIDSPPAEACSENITAVWWAEINLCNRTLFSIQQKSLSVPVHQFTNAPRQWPTIRQVSNDNRTYSQTPARNSCFANKMQEFTQLEHPWVDCLILHQLIDWKKCKSTTELTSSPVNAASIQQVTSDRKFIFPTFLLQHSIKSTAENHWTIFSWIQEIRDYTIHIVVVGTLLSAKQKPSLVKQQTQRKNSKKKKQD